MKPKHSGNYGPSLPPSLATKRDQKNTLDISANMAGSSSTSDIKPPTRVMGPALPENLRKKRDRDSSSSSSTSSSSDDEDDVRKGARHELMADLNERIKDSLTGMSEADRERLEKKLGKKMKTEVAISPKIKLLGAAPEENERTEADDSIFYENRGPSLMELHRQKLMAKKEEKMERRAQIGSSTSPSSSYQNNRVEFDRERDLKVNMFDSKRSREIMKQARQMQDKFSSAKYT